MRALVPFGEVERVITHKVKVAIPRCPEHPFEVFSEADWRMGFASCYLVGFSGRSKCVTTCSFTVSQSQID